MATIVDIADAVAAELNGHTFSQAFTARRLYRPVFDLADMKTLHVSVVPKGVEMQGASRTLVQHDYLIDVGVQKKLPTSPSGDNTEIDALMALVEQIADFFRQRRLQAMPNVVWVKTENPSIYLPEHLDQLRQFTSVLTLTFRVLR
ncbi:MAG: hypothetical protein BWX88_05154 [Planctomycetes bacterium ADurb.Bin126]|nr:MAG: hypothetical protein BWX88_05154 [Planctomycetes bacterium ADurb.Bin126]